MESDSLIAIAANAPRPLALPEATSYVLLSSSVAEKG